MVERKDVVLGVLGAGSAMGGLLLVFLGLIVGALRSFDQGQTPAEVLAPYKVFAAGVVGAFLLSVISVAMAIWWLVGSQGGLVYWVSVATFILQLGLLAIVALWTLWKLVLGR